MPRPPTERSPAECPERACCLHTQTHGCRVVEGLPATEIDSVLDARGGFGQEACPLVALLLRALHRGKPVGSIGDALSDLFLLLKRVSRQVRRRVDVGYLVRCAKHWTVDRQRREGGRPRCGTCRHYGWTSRSCLRRSNPYVGITISPGISPADLDPPCEFFRSRKEPLDVDDMRLSASTPDVDLERLLAGLDRLRGRDPAAEGLLVLLFFEGYSQRDLARMIPCSRRRVATEVEAALRKLGLILEDLS